MSDFLEPTATPETTQEITMSGHNSETLKGKIGAYKEANPTASIEEIAKALNTSKPYVHQSLNNYKKPKKAKAVVKKVLEKKKQSVPTFVQLTNQIGFLEGQIRDLKSNIYQQEAVAKGLRLQNRGLSNVITYLESKLGIDEIEARLESTRD
jgi:hypothetical protein